MSEILEVIEALEYAFQEEILLFKTKLSRLHFTATSMATRGTGTQKNNMSKKRKVCLFSTLNPLDNSSSDGYR